MPTAVEEEDTRKVQTAVAGSPGADRPVYLPMDAAAYDRFMHEYPAREFYCGTLLGGCGKKLSARKYRDKKCHFAHVVSGRCRRTSTNEASADHLYIGRAVADWLKKQRFKNVQVRYKQRGQNLREVVDVSFTRDGSPLRHLMRVQLARRSKAEWERTDAELLTQWADVHWVFGPDSMLANWQVDRRGHALRIQCRPLGVTRVVEVGVQFPATPVEWVPLAKCRMTEHGMQPPALASTPDGLVPRCRETRPPARPVPQADPATLHRVRRVEPVPSLPRGASRTAVLPAAKADRPPCTPETPPPAKPQQQDDQNTPAGSSGPEERPRPSVPLLQQIQAEETRRATERLVLLLDRLDRVGDELHLDQLHGVLRDIAACEKTRWRPLDPVLRRRVASWRSHAMRLAERPTLNEIRAYADLVRWALGTAARTARPLTWTALGTRLDARLPGLHPDDKVAVLVEVDRATCSDRPLLSALVAAHGHRVHPLYAQVLDHLDRPVPAPGEAQAAWERDVRGHMRPGGKRFVVSAEGVPPYARR